MTAPFNLLFKGLEISETYIRLKPEMATLSLTAIVGKT